MKLMRYLVPLFVLAVAAPTLAQQPAAPGPVGIYVAASGGAVIDPRTVPVFGLEVGDRVGRHASAYIAMNYFDDIMSSEMTDDLAAVSQVLTARTGYLWNLQGRDRGVSFIAGAKYLVGTGTTKPYVGGGAGLLGIRRRITERQAGDVTRAALTEFGIGDAALVSNTITRPLAEAAVGVELDFGRTHLDVGYRWRRAFHFDQTPDLSQVGVGIGINF